MKTIIIYHRADFDGVFSREIAKRHFGDAARYIGWDYGDPLPELPPDVVQLYMIDISIDGMMDHPALIWIDHHRSAMAKYPAEIPGYRIDGVAACRLAWQWFEELCRREHGELARALPSLQEYHALCVDEPIAVRLAGEYDVWDKRDPRAELFQHGLRSDEIDWPKLLGRDGALTGQAYVHELLANGAVLQWARKRENESIIKTQSFTLAWEGLTFLACNAARYNSLLFTAGLKPEHDGCLGFKWDGGRRTWSVSLYGVPGKPEIDFAAIAVRHGGGGHKQACGFECASLPFALTSGMPTSGAWIKTTHQLAHVLLAGPDLPIFHFAPSRAGYDDERDTSLSLPEVQENNAAEGLTEEEIAALQAEGRYTGKFLTICGERGEERNCARRGAIPVNSCRAQSMNQPCPGMPALPPVLDACCGPRMFWFDRKDGRALFVNKRRETCFADTREGRREIVVDPDVLADFCSLPFADATFTLVVFDPPHTFAGPGGWTAKKYGTLKPGWQDEIRAGFAECFRVLAPLGTLICKWNEHRVPISTVLALTPEQPLFGQRCGATARTHWIVFHKQPKP